MAEPSIESIAEALRALRPLWIVPDWVKALREQFLNTPNQKNLDAYREAFIRCSGGRVNA